MTNGMYDLLVFLLIQNIIDQQSIIPKNITKRSITAICQKILPIVLEYITEMNSNNELMIDKRKTLVSVSFIQSSQPHTPQKLFNTHSFFTFQLYIGRANKAIGAGKFYKGFIIG
jgi:hypothetical protein